MHSSRTEQSGAGFDREEGWTSCEAESNGLGVFVDAGDVTNGRNATDFDGELFESEEPVMSIDTF